MTDDMMKRSDKERSLDDPASLAGRRIRDREDMDAFLSALRNTFGSFRKDRD